MKAQSTALLAAIDRAPITGNIARGPRPVPKAPSWQDSAVLNNFFQWLQHDDGSLKSEKDARQYTKQVATIFEKVGVTDSTNLPNLSNEVWSKFCKPATDEKKLTPSTIKI